MEVLEMTEEEAIEKFPITDKQEKKWKSKFDAQARYMGGGFYSWMGYYATDTRELFVKAVISQENNIAYKDD